MANADPALRALVEQRDALERQIGELKLRKDGIDPATYDQQLAMALAAERAGFGAFFRSDHFLTMAGSGLPGPTDAWVVPSALGNTGPGQSSRPGGAAVMSS